METIKHAITAVPLSLQVLFGTIVITLVYTYLKSDHRPVRGIPIVTLPRKSWREALSPQNDWIQNGGALLAKGDKEVAGCFQIYTSTGYKVVVPNHFANELKNHRNLNLSGAFAKEFPVHYPGFEGFREQRIGTDFIPGIVRRNLTQSLGLVTADLVDETNSSFHEILGESSEWTSRSIKQDMLDIVARLSSRVFLGKDLCRDAAWLDISKNYTVSLFLASQEMRRWSAILRPMAYWFIPECTALRGQVRKARSLIDPEIEQRRKHTEASIAAGGKAPKSADTIGWMVEAAKGGKVDYAAAQLTLTMAAIHTTSETMTKCILQLCETPEVVEPLRKEILDVLRDGGWSRVALFRMKLLDSFMKEVQRFDSMSRVSMNRFVKSDIILSNGEKLPAGSRVMVNDDKAKNPSIYADANKFNVERFLQMRQQPGEENRHQFVTPSPELMGFGYGEHACPGRFFVSNEIKIALAFLLLKYDLRFVPEQEKPKTMEVEASLMTIPTARVEIRRRAEEVDLMDLGASES